MLLVPDGILNFMMHVAVLIEETIPYNSSYDIKLAPFYTFYVD